MRSDTRRSVGDRSSVVAMILFSLAAGAWSAPVLAQGRDTGVVEVVVRTSDGAPAADAEVTLEGPQRSRVVRTGSHGVARFPGLIPGSYRATVVANGFPPHRSPAIRVITGELREATIELAAASVQELVVVPGARPVIDPSSVGVGAVVDPELIDRTPSGGGLWNAVLDKVPGLVLSGTDVGGGNASQQQIFSAHGSLTQQNQFNVNGTQATDFRSGAAGMLFPVHAFAEVQVSTAAHDIEYQGPGVIVNMVSKSGSNRIHGGIRYAYSNEDLSSDNVSEELLAQGLARGNPNTLLSDLDLQLGGPIARDRLWGFVDYWRFDEERLILGVPPDERDERSLRNVTVNLDWQVADRQRLALRYFYSDKFRVNALASAQVPPASALLQDPSDNHVVQANWLGGWGENLYADVRVAFRDTVFGNIGRRPDSPAPHPDFPVGIPTTLDLVTGAWSGAPPEARVWERSWEASGHAARTIRGEGVTHDLKVGFSAFDGQTWDTSISPGGSLGLLFDGDPAFVQLLTTPAGTLETVGRDGGERTHGRAYSLYVQDSLGLGDRWHVTAGLRWDRSRAWIPPQIRPPSHWAGLIPDDEGGANFRPATFPEIDGISWSDLVPRIAATFDAAGDGDTLLKASYGEYSLQQVTGAVDAINPNSSGTNTYFWEDSNGDGVFQWGEQGLFLGSFFPGVNTAFDSDLDSARTRELTLGFEHRLVDDLVVSATGIYRTVDNPIERINIGVPYGPIAERLGVDSAYTPVTVTDPGPDGIVGTADDGGPITAWSQDPSTFGQNRFLVTNPETWGFDVPYDYRGLELVARKRFTDRWQVLASWTIGRIDSSLGGAGDTGFTTGSRFQDPNADINRRGRASGDRTHVVKVNASTLVEPLDVGVAISLRHESGRPVSRAFRTERGDLAQGREVITAAAIGTEDVAGSFNGRLEAITLLDFRAEKSFAMPGRWGRVTVAFEAFNVLNEAAPRAAVTFSGPNYGRIFEIVPPRLFRLSADWMF